MPIRAGELLSHLLARVRTFSPGLAPRADPWHLTFTSFTQCRELLDANASLFGERRIMESQLADALGSRPMDTLAGYCWVCSRPTRFTYDRQYADGIHVNWRERLERPGSRLNNRLHLSTQALGRSLQRMDADYLTEQLTPLETYLSKRYRNLVGSEYLGDGLRPGTVGANGTRHEDVTELSFRDATFDWVLSFDVLEHVPDYRCALKEFRRVLRGGGKLLLSVPFSLLSESNIVRARRAADGQVEHLLPPEYHGDPVDPQRGILCYYHFGWELLRDLEQVGFRSARIDAFWSREYGHIGDEQLLIAASC